MRDKFAAHPAATRRGARQSSRSIWLVSSGSRYRVPNAVSTASIPGIVEERSTPSTARRLPRSTSTSPGVRSALLRVSVPAVVSWRSASAMAAPRRYIAASACCRAMHSAASSYGSVMPLVSRWVM